MRPACSGVVARAVSSVAWIAVWIAVWGAVAGAFWSAAESAGGRAEGRAVRSADASAAAAEPVAPLAATASVLVSAASSLAGVLEDVGRRYEARHGERVALNVGASNTLARQILAGAKVDLFISADDAQMDKVATLIVPGTRARLLSNQLAIVAPTDRPQPIGSAHDLTAQGVRRVAIGDPDAVPVGVYARTYLRRLGLWTAIEPKTVPLGSARLALSAVEHGAADAAIVYRTDLAGARGVRMVYLVPPTEGPVIVYPAAVVRGGPNPAGAERFLRFLLQDAEAAGVFARAGFVPVARSGAAPAAAARSRPRSSRRSEAQPR
jgi:molybdate transport system substrate-binding protein